MMTIYRHVRDILVFVLLALPTLALMNCGGGGGGGGVTPGSGDTTAPAVVSGLTVSAVSSVQINLSWTASSDSVGVTGYNIYRGTGSGAATYLKTVTGTSTSDAGLTANTQYCYKISACDAAANESTQCAQQCVTTPPGGGSAVPEIQGFNFNLSEGDFWEFGWKRQTSTFSSYSGSSSSSQSSYFRITLGAQTTIQGVPSHPILASGSGNYVKGRWTHLANADGIFYASSDGTTLKELFNAQTGFVQGNGFFAGLGGSLYQATASSLSNDFITDPSVFVLGKSSSSSQCQYYPGVGTICGESGSSSNTKEYYKAGIGPVGFYDYSSYQSGSGMDSYSSSTTKNIGLVKSSLRGDVVDYLLETEPNNSLAEATLVSLPAKFQGDASDDAATATTVLLNSTAETEPNDSHLSAQVLMIPMMVTGDTSTGDAGTIEDLSLIQAGSPSIEDWYQVSVPASAGTLQVDLDFSGGPSADLDLYLLNYGNQMIYGHSYANNLAAGAALKESISASSLPAGTYHVAVDAFDTKGMRINYTLNSYFTNRKNEVSVCDWYKITLASSQAISASATNGWSLVLTDSAGTTTLASGVPATAGGSASLLSAILTPGTYYIGMGDSASVQGRYVLTISVQ